MDLDTILKNIETHIDALENELTLKKSYNEELMELDQFESDIMTVTHFGTSVTANNLIKRIKHIRNWINEEITN